MKRKLLSLGLVVVLLLTTMVPVSAAEVVPSDDMTASADDFNAAELLAEPVEDFDALTSEEGTAEVPYAKAETEGMEFEEDEDMAILMGEEGEVPPPTISVVGGTGSFEIFPYKFDHDNQPQDDQFTSDVYYVQSISTKDIDLKVIPSGLPLEGSEATFSKTLETFNTYKLTKKKLFVWFEFQPVESMDDSEELTWSGEYTGAAGQVIVNGKKQVAATIEALEEEQEAAYVAFKAFAYVSTPSTVWWKATDGVTFSLTFSFVKSQTAQLLGFIEDEEPITEPVEDEEPSDIAEPLDNAEPSDIAEPADNAEPFEVAEPFDVAEPVEEIGAPVEDEEPESGNAELSYAANAEPSDVAEPVDDAEPFDVGTPVEDMEASDVPELIENGELLAVVKPVDDAEVSGLAEPDDAAEAVDNAEVSDIAEAVDTVEIRSHTKWRGSSGSSGSGSSDFMEPVEVAEPVEDTEPSGVAEPVEDAEPSNDTEVVEEMGVPVEDVKPEPDDDAELSGVAEVVGDASE